MADTILDTHMRLVPAYGRVYPTLDRMEQDWNDGKDFRIVGGPYCSKRDVDRMRDMGFKGVIIQNIGAVDNPVVLVVNFLS